MLATEDLLNQMKISRPDHLPVVAAFCRRINLINVIDRIVPNEMEVSVGTLVQGMVLDTLSGRSPLYRLEEFFKHQDTLLLLGQDVNSTPFNDTTVARAMDEIFDIGAEKVFNEVAFSASDSLLG